MRLIRILRSLLGLCAVACLVRAHTPDTSYCRIAIGRDAVDFSFSFDLALLRSVTPIDTNHDGRITPEELSAAAPAVDKFLRENVYLELNEREAVFATFTPPGWPADAGQTIGQADWGQRLVTFSYHNALLNAPDAVAITFDFFTTLGDRHTVLGNFIWEGRENPVIFTRFEPDYLFDTGYRVPAWDQFLEYLRLGIEHIFRGYDHLAFLLALFFVRRFRELVKIITAFSVAHTITLALAALGVVALPTRWVEIAIAASIVYVAAQNLWTDPDKLHRWRITFAFGLVHGFGFATVLRQLGLPSEGLVRSLLAFNLGVEVGQLAIAAVTWPLILWLSRQTWSVRARWVVSSVLLAFGALWLVERLLNLKFMPL